MNYQGIASSFFVFILLCISQLHFVSGQTAITLSLKSGPTLERVQYRILSDEDQCIASLLEDEIDLVGESINTTYYETLSQAQNVQIESTLRNGYGYFSINCMRYPYNITAFRRAFAFALDKHSISEEVWDGLSVPLDSCIPQNNPFSIEDNLDYSYYDANVSYGNYLLDMAGFLDIDNDTIREAPDGSDFDVVIDVADNSPVALQCGAFAEDTLHALAIDATAVASDFYNWLWHGFYNYDMMFLDSSFYNFDVDWLAYEYWSEYAYELYWNSPHFRNASFDSWREQLLHSVSYEEVYEAAIEMQRALTYECPIVVCYENYLLSAHRIDRVTGFVNDALKGVPNWWTNYKVAPRESQYRDDPLRIGTLDDIGSFNFMYYDTSAPLIHQVAENLYDSLIRQTPDGTDIPWLAESYSIQTHEDNPSIANETTRIVFKLVENATWSDGVPLTADDVAFTMNFYRDAPMNPYGADLSSLSAAYNRSRYEAVIEFNTQSYWHLHTIGYKPILPKHILSEIPIEDWTLWDPNPPMEPMITSGPFYISAYSQGEFLELSRNDNYFLAYVGSMSTDGDGTGTSPTGNQDIFSLIPPQHLFITLPSMIVIVVVLVKWKLARPSMKYDSY